MQVNGPRDLPDFRLWLIDQWRHGGLYDEVASVHEHLGTMGTVDGVPIAALEASVERASLPRAALWWASPEMSALIDRTSRTLPPTTLTEDLLPDDYGLVVFGERLSGVAADTGSPITIEALSWCIGTARHSGEAELAITSYRHHRPGDRVEKAGRVAGPDDRNTIQVGDGPALVIETDVAHDHIWIPVGLCNWTLGFDTEAPSMEGFAEDATRLASMSEDRRWLAALWLLASQPLAESVIQEADRPAARRSKRASLSSDVRLVNVRRRAHEGAHEPLESGKGGRTYSRRWLVEGFWRQQACGPQWKDHRPVFVESHVRGPKDKPLVVRETVKVVKGDS